MGPALTAGNDDPDEVHEEEVEPEVVCFRAAILLASIVQIKHAGRIVENIAVDLAERDDALERISERGLGRDHVRHDERERTPGSLSTTIEPG